MIDFIREEPVVCAIAAVFIAFFVAVFVTATNNDNRLLNECLADGRKKYECMSMLRGGQPIVMPVVVPMGR